MPRTPEHIRAMARAHSQLAIRTLTGICASGKQEGARVQAATELLNRGWGRAQVDDADREGIVITIRKILEGAQVTEAPGAPKQLTIEGKVNGHGDD
jgi:hypothetical protein